MKEVIYTWIRNMVFYQLITSIILNLIPNNVYLKYIRFFLGMLFIVIAIQPVFHFFRLTDRIDVDYVHRMLEQELEERDWNYYMEVPETEYEEIQ